jgi:hypothetical protein
MKSPLSLLWMGEREGVPPHDPRPDRVIAPSGTPMTEKTIV